MSEADLQISVVHWLRVTQPQALVQHSANEGKRNVAYNVKLKRMGLTAGWPDLQIIFPPDQFKKDVTPNDIYIELKYGKGRVSKKQKVILDKLADYGKYVAVCYSLNEVQTLLEEVVTL